jgi:alkylhydroperoxidase family enzyme
MRGEGQPRIALDNQVQGLVVGSELESAVNEFANAAMRADAIDPLITEMVRLRCAGVHDCRVCGSLRLADALAAGLEDDAAQRVADYRSGDLDPAAVAALRLTDAIILTPGEVDADLAEELHRHFNDAQIAEICLDVAKWSHQKVLVALRLEKPPWDERTVLSFDAEGDAVIGGPVREFTAPA